MAITAVINQKGGVAKTTTSINVAASWATMGKKVLLIDLDPQSSATKAIFGDQEFDNTAYDLVVGRIQPEKAIVHSERFGIDVIPAEIMLSGVDLQLAPQFGREQFLKKKLKNIRYRYDAIIIDCSPSLGLLTINALMACQDIIIPICPEYFSMKGIDLILDTLNNIQTGLGHKIDVRGVIITRYKNRRVIKDVIEQVERHYGLQVFKNYIPDNIAVEEAHHKHLPVFKHAPRSPASKAYTKLAKDLWL